MSSPVTKYRIIHTISKLLTHVSVLGWRKVLEDNEHGNIDRIVWYDQEAVIVTGHGRRVRALRYADGLEVWQLAAAASNNPNAESTTPKHCQVVQNRYDPGIHLSTILRDKIESITHIAMHFFHCQMRIKSKSRELRESYCWLY